MTSKKMPTSVVLDSELLEQLQTRKTNEGVTIHFQIQEAIKKMLEKTENNGVCKNANP